MLCLLWVSDTKFPSTVTALYKTVILHLARHKSAKGMTSDDLDEHSIQLWIDDEVLSHVGAVALDGLFEDRLLFKATEFRPSHLEEACNLGIVVKERQISGTSVIYSVQFIHKTFQQLCAAFYWGQLIEKDRDKFDTYLRRISSDNIFQMEYLLRFACGLNVNTAECILPHVVPIMCNHKWLKYESSGTVEDILRNKCQHLPLFLLYETERNSADAASSQLLHAVLKPLYNFVLIDSRHSSNMSSEFDGVLDHYIMLQHKPSANNAHKHTWLDDVEQVTIQSGGDMEAKLLCAMQSVAVLHFEKVPEFSSFLSLLTTGRVCSSSLSELIVQEVKCDANRFFEFLSTVPSLITLVLKLVKLYGETSVLPSCPALKELTIVHLYESSTGWKAILKEFSQRVDMIKQQHLDQCLGTKHSTNANACIPIETITITSTGLDLDDACEIAKALEYMFHLRRLVLSFNEMQSSVCGKILDGFVAASQHIQRCHGDDVEDTGGAKSDRGILLEELNLSGNKIGDSIGTFVNAYRYMTCLKYLSLELTYLQSRQCEILFDGFIEVGRSRNGGLALENLNLIECKIGQSVTKFAQAFKCMPRLRCLNLQNTGMNATQWGVLFDGFIEAGKVQVNHIEMSGETQITGLCTRSHGLSIEELDLSRNDIGESVGKLARALKYMTSLRCLHLEDIYMKPTQWGVLFDEFIAVGKMLSKQDEMSGDDTQDHSTSTTRRGLNIEILNLSDNRLGESVDKLIEALKYMPRLKQLWLYNCHLEEKNRHLITKVLSDINSEFNIKCHHGGYELSWTAGHQGQDT